MSNWTEQDMLDAKKIVDAIARGNGNIIGSLQVARGADFRMPKTDTGKERIKRRVYYLMPLAVELSVQMYPGRVIQYWSDGTYKMADDLNGEALRVAIGRTNKGFTALNRAALETSVGKTPTQKMLNQVIRMAAAMSEGFESLAERAMEETES